MGRPTKKGIDYFPIDTTFDDKVELFIAENGADSLSVLITTWQLIYGGQGYFANFTDDLLLLIRRRLLLDMSRIREVLEAAVRREIFSSEHLQKHGILTCRAIQLNYLVAARKKKTVSLVKDYLFNGVSDARNPNAVWVSDAGNDRKEKNSGVFDGGNATKEKEEEKEEKNYCSAPTNGTEPQLNKTAVITIPLIKRDGDFAVTQSDINEWQSTFPGVDVVHAIKGCRQWNLDNPARRKTTGGIRRHITGWLAQEHDRPGGRRIQQVGADEWM